MSDREKRLLFLLLGALFVVVNLGLYKKVYEPRVKAAASELSAAELALSEAQGMIDTRDLYEKEMSWLARHEPKPATVQQTQTKLQQMVANFARSNNLTIKRQKLQPSITNANLKYHRARIQIEVNGMEKQLFQWLSRLHSPNEFRAVTFMRINPQKNDDTRIDCEVIIEQLFVPPGEDNGTKERS